jgi:hypothetical protein
VGPAAGNEPGSRESRGISGPEVLAFALKCIDNPYRLVVSLAHANLTVRRKARQFPVDNRAHAYRRFNDLPPHDAQGGFTVDSPSTIEVLSRPDGAKMSELQILRNLHPWPDVSGLDGQPSYIWSLDGGGRHLIVQLIREWRPKIFLEVGVFLGGSSLQWLQNSDSDMTLLAADTWNHIAENWVFTMASKPAPWIADLEPLLAVQRPIKEYGIYKVALHNLRKFRDRVIPLRMRVAEVYAYLKRFVEPDIIYIDAGKERQDYFLAHEIFPNSILCGDDWEWQDSNGEFAVRPFVHELAEARHCEVVAEHATWILKPLRD